MDQIRKNNDELEMTDVMMHQQDLIDNATYDVCCSYLGISDEERETVFPWNMQILSTVRKSITDALLQFGNAVCYPYIVTTEEGSHYCQTDECYCKVCVRESSSATFLKYAFSEFSEQPLYFMKANLDTEERMRLLRQFDMWYENTNQETELYALEYAVITRMLIDNAIVLNPRYLALEEVLNELLSLIPDSKRRLYRQYFIKIQEGHTPDTEE